MAAKSQKETFKHYMPPDGRHLIQQSKKIVFEPQPEQAFRFNNQFIENTEEKGTC